MGADRDYFLRVTASYNDGHDDKTLLKTSELATAATSASNMPPAFPSPLFAGGVTGLSVRENAGARTVVGVAPQATDPESGTLTYSLAVSGFTSDPPFEINPNSNSRQIRVASGAASSITRSKESLQRDGDGGGRPSTPPPRPRSTSLFWTSTNGPWRSPTHR